MTREELIAAIKRNSFSQNNARLAVSRISGFVDEDADGQLRLLSTGLRRAEDIIRQAMKS